MIKHSMQVECAFNFLFIFQANLRELSLESQYALSQNTNPKPMGEQWLSGRVLDSRPRGRGFQPHWRHCVLVLEQNTFILA